MQVSVVQFRPWAPLSSWPHELSALIPSATFQSDAHTRQPHSGRTKMSNWSRVLLLLAMLVSSDAFAQAYPTRSVTIVAATTPGSLPDVLARAIGQRLSQKWGQ